MSTDWRRYGAVITSDGGTGQCRLMLVCSASSKWPDSWQAMEVSPSTTLGRYRYGRTGELIIISSVVPKDLPSGWTLVEEAP